MAAHKGESFDSLGFDRIVTPSQTVRHSYGDVNKFFYQGDSVAELSKISTLQTAFPSNATFTMDNNTLVRKKRLSPTKKISTVEGDEIDNVEMKIMQ